MYWIQSGIKNPSKSEVIGRCGGDKKNEWPRFSVDYIRHKVSHFDRYTNSADLMELGIFFI